MDRWEDYPEDDGADWWHQLDQEARRFEEETGKAPEQISDLIEKADKPEEAKCR